MKFDKELENTIKAKTKIIQIISYETLRIHGAIIKVANNLDRELFVWNRIEGIRKWDKENRKFIEEDEDKKESDQVLEFFTDEDLENAIVLLEDFHPNLAEHEVQNIRRLRNIALSNSQSKTLILSQPFPALPPELEKEVHIMDLEYPNSDDIKAIYDKVCNDFEINNIDPDEDLIESALGLTIMEAERAFSRAYIEDKELTSVQIPIIIKEKENIIKKSGFLEYYHPKETMDDVGGLDNLKDWLQKRGRGFDKHAKEFGLETPKGILLLGIPGTGKSLIAKAIGSEWQFPLLRLDMGKIFGGIVGESERNIRGALNIAEAISPSILWIDEIEKGMSGISSSGGSDGGTTARVLGTFLTWMQEKEKPVFVVATANNISQLPPELLRKGRVDEIFFVDLPTENEREAIIKIHTDKRRPNSSFDLKKLAEKSKGFSGAELEEAVKEGMFQAYDEERDLETQHIVDALEKTYPLAKTRVKEINDMRKWAKSKAVMASNSSPETLDIKDEEKILKLKQEQYNNPFI
ncbi:AAA family ATPase [Tenacibaculum finnmarkense]|uniref:AAA family ATPase n=1 Tax=Tenacibaculum finnmarkense TaxID=2781243 RepID=UPI001EFA4BA4|nr:AAA family ATPase [Tenacibaculum finnmarkense]MCG8858891.1 AAA family ATPase [Tenacibaculum finnmarkense]